MVYPLKSTPRPIKFFCVCMCVRVEGGRECACMYYVCICVLCVCEYVLCVCICGNLISRVLAPPLSHVYTKRYLEIRLCMSSGRCKCACRK